MSTQLGASSSPGIDGHATIPNMLGKPSGLIWMSWKGPDAELLKRHLESLTGRSDLLAGVRVPPCRRSASGHRQWERSGRRRIVGVAIVGVRAAALPLALYKGAAHALVVVAAREPAHAAGLDRVDVAPVVQHWERATEEGLESVRKLVVNGHVRDDIGRAYADVVQVVECVSWMLHARRLHKPIRVGATGDVDDADLIAQLRELAADLDGAGRQALQRVAARLRGLLRGAYAAE